jgi:hypothetical protein
VSEDTRADREFSTYTLAINDMEHVGAVARLIADHDPLFNPLGPTVALPHGLHRKQMTALVRRADGIAGALNDDQLRTVLETGLIVTYARPFTEGQGSGFPIPAEKFVPADMRELHKTMLKLRHKVQAHMDAPAPEGFRRSVTRREEPGVSSVALRGARYLSVTELREVAKLADEVIERLASAGGRVMRPK